MLCPKCGKEIDDGNEICLCCGTILPKEEEIKIISQIKIEDKSSETIVSIEKKERESIIKKLKRIPKKTYIGIMLIIAILSVSVIIYNYRQNVIEQNSCNAQSNMSNGGYVVKDGDYIFFYSGKDKCFYKMKEDGTNKTKIMQQDSPITYLSINSGYIYYQNYAIKPGLYRVKIDGTDNRKIVNGNVNFYRIYKNKIYYIINSMQKVADDKSQFDLYKANMDGSNEKKLVQGVEDNSNVFYIHKNSIYFMKVDALTNIASLNRINIGGKNETKIFDIYVHDISINKESLAYVKDSDVDIGNSYIYVSDLNMKVNKKLVNLKNSAVSSVNINDGYVYYSLVNEDNSKFGIYRIKIDGTENKRICNAKGQSSINIIGEWVYYSEMEYKDNEVYTKLSRVKKDGSKNEVIDEYHYNFNEMLNIQISD